MRIAKAATIVLTGLVLCAPALAQERQPAAPAPALQPEVLFKGLVKESDVRLFFDYLRAALAAAAQGKEAPPSGELQKRAETLANELKLRGMASALALIGELEAEARRLLREGVSPSRPALPPTAPYSRI